MNSFTHAFLVTIDLSTTDLVHADYCQTKKKCTSQGQGVGSKILYQNGARLLAET